MEKPTSAFRLKKKFKTLIALEKDPQKRAALKKNFIQAQLAEERKEPTKKG